MSLTMQQFLLQIYQKKPEFKEYQEYVISFLEDTLTGKKSFTVDTTFLDALEQHLAPQKFAKEKEEKERKQKMLQEEEAKKIKKEEQEREEQENQA